jgi:hypothetical protein
VGGFTTPGGGASAKEIWEYATRTLTQYKRTAEIVKNKDYDAATLEDIVGCIIVKHLGAVTVDQLADFMNYGIVYRNAVGVFARVISVNPYNLWDISKIVDVFNSAYFATSSLKSLLADSALVADKAQAILYSMVDAGYYDKVLDLITFDAPDYSVTASTTLTTGVNRYKTLSVASGVTLTLGASPGVIIANTVSNSGVIESGWTRGSGGSPGTSGAGAGGSGAGGIIVLARSVTIGTMRADGKAGGSASTVAANGNGGGGGGGAFWVISPNTPPSGGRGGGGTVVGGAGNPNGGGGGGTRIYVGGAGGSASVTSFPDATSLLNELLKAVCDWWLVNVLGKTPSSTKSIPSLGGSGGGGGAGEDTYGASGGGGGGGGEIIVYGTSVTAGTLSAVGGVGGNGGTEGAYDGGGGGGGGGVIYVFYKSLSGTNTFNVSGGAGGVGDYSGYAGGSGVAREIAV